MTTPQGIWSPRHVWTTAGAVALIFLAAVQALAVTTIMPLVSADLDGASLYAVAFAGSLAAGIVGMVVAGAWSDRTDPTAALIASVLLFAGGLVITAAAPTMGVVVAGRLLQGFGSGGQIVALYVVVARVYPPELHGRVFAAFSAAWVVPSLIGPFLAGAVAELLDWRWVFFGLAVLAIAALILLRSRLPVIPASEPAETPSRAASFPRRLIAATFVAGGCLALSLAPQAGRWSPAVVVASLIVVAVAIRPLVPPGTLRARRGLPSVVLLRGLVAGSFFAAEVYVPYLLVDGYGFSATWAGLGLTGAALAWAAGSALQGRYGDVWGSRRIALSGVAAVAVAISTAVLTAAFALSPAILIAGWTIAGGGMGLVYPRLTVLTLRYSTTADQGFHSAALSIFDSAGAATTIAAAGVVFTALVATGAGFAAVFGLALGVALLGLLPATRLDRRAV